MNERRIGWLQRGAGVPASLSILRFGPAAAQAQASALKRSRKSYGAAVVGTRNYSCPLHLDYRIRQLLRSFHPRVLQFPLHVFLFPQRGEAYTEPISTMLFLQPIRRFSATEVSLNHLKVY